MLRIKPTIPEQPYKGGKQAPRLVLLRLGYLVTMLVFDANVLFQAGPDRNGLPSCSPVNTLTPLRWYPPVQAVSKEVNRDNQRGLSIPLLKSTNRIG